MYFIDPKTKVTFYLSLKCNNIFAEMGYIKLTQSCDYFLCCDVIKQNTSHLFFFLHWFHMFTRLNDNSNNTT